MSGDSIFRFKRFEVHNIDSALKVGTDAVLLGAAMTILPTDGLLLDIGTGTGVIALMAAQRLSDIAGGRDFRIDAIDIDAPSAREAARNFEESPWGHALSASHIALESFAPAGQYDLIFSNPPYYDNSLLNPDAREAAARHTESLSYRDICSFASEWLGLEGRLSLILPYECGHMLKRTAASFGLYPFRTIAVRTTAAKPPRRLIAEFGRVRAVPEESMLTLQDGASRTQEYDSLTEDFYL